uniref:Protein NDUFAF4 homolog n=1 Tax=Corethrella appendiculata TaxID=1370023 RepID=U5EYC8_9DIPT
MGQVGSFIIRKANRFNAENRAHKIISQEKPKAAPKYEQTLRDMERVLKVNPSILEEIGNKNTALDERLKQVYVTSEDKIIIPSSKSDSDTKNLPLNRSASDDYEFGHLEPETVKPGYCSLRQAVKFISDHQTTPQEWTAERISQDYQIKKETVDDILKHFRTFKVFLPDKNAKTKEKLLMDPDTAKNKFLLEQEEKKENPPKSS